MKGHFVAAILSLLSAQSVVAGQYANFDVAVYIVASTAQRQLSDPKALEAQYERAASQLKFDKVYLETYRDSLFVDEKTLTSIKRFFERKGVKVAGGITLAKGGHGGQFGTFDYESAADREECRRAVELTARHFDEIVLDDFFFYTTKSDANIAAKGSRSWTQYRLEKMREVAENLVIKPAKAVNPKVKVIIKYPNWYEHFQALGYDLDVEAKMFDAVYTGTETRDPDITDQLLQQYQSYLTFRYFDNIRPDYSPDAAKSGGNRGGWVDTFSTRYIDRYAEQLWDTMFAKAPEITLFNWTDMASPKAAEPGHRSTWANKPTSFRWDEMVGSFKSKNGAAPGWGRVAGYSLEQVDAFLGKLGKPMGIASYKPYQSSGEDFLHNYLGNIGIPIELTPVFPESADLVLLTESAKHDPQIVERMKRQLAAGRNVAITSGLLRALHGKGIEDVVELEHTDRRVAIREFLNGYGAGNGTSLNDRADNPSIVFPEIRFFTNDSWVLVRGVAHSKGFPILLMNRYSRGILYVLSIPDNPGDLYNLPQPVVTVIKGYLQDNFPVRIDAPERVSLFAYDNKTFIIQSFRDDEAKAKVSVAAGAMRLRNLVTGEVQSLTAIPVNQRQKVPGRSEAAVTVQPHSYGVYAVE
ncbi:hypothetical protein HNQ60_003761 [Povalibacter uvarum]|uniref:Uncharacterized protein n=1 Tax=Povalibacter uvarum TaxID=732238 RepID=A0A841HQF8_9GAMM|nr:hypothetical protein [Povalibacter uvarum]MBB6094874.1 hypothetical protein [Povalibacter uvarum]